MDTEEAGPVQGFEDSTEQHISGNDLVEDAVSGTAAGPRSGSGAGDVEEDEDEVEEDEDEDEDDAYGLLSRLAARLRRVPKLDPIEVTTSNASSSVVYEILKRLKIAISPFRIGTIGYPRRSDASDSAVAKFEWPPGSDETSPSIREAVRNFLQQHLAPEGVVVVDTRKPLGLEARWESQNVSILDLDTDYAFALAEGVNVGADLPAEPKDIIGLYGVKTTENLKATMVECQAQGALTFLTVHRMFDTFLSLANIPSDSGQSPTVVVTGDLNTHITYCMLPYDHTNCTSGVARGKGTIIKIVVNDSRHIPTGDYRAVSYIKDALTKAAASRRRLIPEMYYHAPKNAAGTGRQVSDPHGSGAPGRADAHGSGPGRSAESKSSSLGATFDTQVADDYEYIEGDIESLKAAADARFKDCVVEMFKSPHIYRAFGKTCPPTSITCSSLWDRWGTLSLGSKEEAPRKAQDGPDEL